MKQKTDSIPLSEWSHLPKGQGELILLVQEDQLLQAMNTRVLERLGYQVLPSHNPQTGFELWQSRRQEIKLVLTSYHFRPPHTGMDLLHRIQKLEPELPCLVVSGTWEPDAKTDLPLPPHVAYLRKPYPLAALAHTLHGLLHERRSKALPWVPRVPSAE